MLVSLQLMCYTNLYTWDLLAVISKSRLLPTSGPIQLMVDSHWRPAVRSPVQYGPGRLVSPSGTDMKLVNGPGSGVNARRPAPSA